MVANVLVSVCTAVALWLSAGALTLADEPGAPRLGLLPSPLWLAAILAICVGVAVGAKQHRRRFRILWLSSLLILPWLPVRIPMSLLVWTGALRLAVWVAIASVLFGPSIARRPLIARRAFVDPRRAPWLAAAIAAALYLAASWQVSPRLPGGDEPHYLAITQSLLLDHDLKIENNHLRGDYRQYFPGRLRPDYLRRGTNGEIYSIHSPGLPAIVAPVFGAFGYPGVVVFLAIVSALASGLAWSTAWRICRHAGASWFAWAAVALSAPFFYQAFAVYPDALGGALLLAGVSTLIVAEDCSSRRLFAAGLCAAVLPWLHTRLVIGASALGALFLLRLMRRPHALPRAAALLSMPLLSAVCWFSFFYVIYGTADPRAPYGSASDTAAANLPRGILGLLVDQQFGLLTNAPIYVCAGLGFVTLLRRERRLAIELAVLVLPQALVVAAYQMWWGGQSSPARFLTPVLLLQAIPIAVWFTSAAGRAARLFAGAGLFLSLLITTALAAVDRGSLLYNVRDGASLLLLWASPLVDLTTALPSLFQNRPAVVLAQAGVWAAALALTGAIGALAARRALSTTAVALALGAAAAVTGTAAVQTVWRTNAAAPLTPFPASLALLQTYEPESGQRLIRYPGRDSRLKRLPLSAAVSTASLPIATTGHDAGRVRRYGPAAVVRIDGAAYMERPGAWIAGGEGARFLIAPDTTADMQLFVRNAPVANLVELVAGSWREQLMMKPREERTFTLPGKRSLLHITTTAGARPSEFEPGSPDTRWLGCWIEIR